MDVVAMIGISLDGVMQSPARPDEDERDGFALGGWAVPFEDPGHRVTAVAQSGLRAEAILLGRRTYLDLFAAWSERTDGNPHTDSLNRARKYVASGTLTEPLPWGNSTLLSGDAADAVAELRRRPGGDLLIIGSGDLVRSLMRRDLIDRYIISTHPVVLGSGRRLFDEVGPRARLELVAAEAAANGVVIATYRTVRPAPGP